MKQHIGGHIMGEKGADYHLHQTYWTNLKRLSGADVDDFHGLSVTVNWPHRPQDIDMLLRLGQGYIARDSIARPLGAGMWFDYENDAAMISMMITHPKLQTGGLGSEVLAAIEVQLDGFRVRLNATRSAWRLYRSTGFRDTGNVVQYQGIVRSDDQEPTMALGVRAADLGDLSAIRALDGNVFGAKRDDVLAQIFARSQTYVMEDAGQITGFAMCRIFGRGHVVGPLIAGSEADAIALVRVFARDHANEFLRLDADARHSELGRYLNSVGLETYDTVVAMTKGTHFGPEDAVEHVYALASQALG